jgi:chromosome segregation ATPase
VTTKLELPCPNCQRNLRIRTEYVGKRIACKYCEHVFRPEAKDGHMPPPAAPAAAPPAPDVAAQAAQQRIAQLQTELRKAQSDLADRTAEHGTAVQEAEHTRAKAGRLEQQLQALRSGADEAEARHRRDSATKQQELTTARADAARLGEQITGLKERADQVARLEVELQNAQLATTMLEQKAAGWQQELATAREESQRLRHQVAELQRHETGLAEAETKLKAAVAETMRLQDELAISQASCQDLAGQLGAAESQAQELATHRAASVELDRQRQEAEQLKAKISDLEKTLQVTTAAHSELVQHHEDTEQRFHGERLHLTQALEQSRSHRELITRSRGELAEQLQTVDAERAALQAELQLARSGLAARGTDHSSGAQDLERALEEAARLEHQLKAVRQTAAEGEARHQEEDAERQKALVAVRHEVLQLRAQLADLPTLQEEIEKTLGELAGMTADHASAVEETESVRQEAAALEQQCADARREADQLREQIAKLEPLAGPPAGTEAELRPARASSTRMESEVAALSLSCKNLADQVTNANERAQQFEAERNTLAEQLQRLQSQRPGGSEESGGNLLHKALDAAFSGARRLRIEDPKAEAEAQAMEQRLKAADEQFTRERTALHNEVARLRQENSNMRQWLQRCGVTLS